eukprot:jgi/Astpho2/4843/Aster-05779
MKSCKPVAGASQDAYIRLYDRKEGQLFAECPIPRGVPQTTVVEPVTDSSRYFVLRVEDADSRRHAFLGFGFRQLCTNSEARLICPLPSRDRAQASDFNAALHEHAQHLRRKQEALEMRAAFESSQGQDTDGTVEGAGGRKFQTNFSLKEGETLTLKLANTKLGDRPGSFSMKGAKLANPIDLFGKGKAVGYEFAVKVHAIEPWPGSYPCLAVAWQRGTGKKGVTKAANATRHPGADWASFLIEDTIHVSATLFQDTSKGKRPPGEEAFEQKWLILSIIEGGSRSKPGVLGQVVINMADYAADDQQAQQSFVVAVARKDVSNAVGEVRMLATVGCRLKGKGPMQIDDALIFAGDYSAADSPSNRSQGTDFGDEILDQGGIMQYESASQFGTPHKSMMMESIPESPTADEQPPISSEGAAAARARFSAGRTAPALLAPQHEPQQMQQAAPGQAPRQQPPPVAASAAKRSQKPGKASQYDEDGFLIESDDEDAEGAEQPPSPQRVAGLPNGPTQAAGAGRVQQAAPMETKPSGSSSESDEDDLLARAVADMEEKELSASGRQMQQQGRAEAPSAFMRRRTTSDSEEVPQAGLARTSAGSGSSSVGQNPFMQANAKRQAVAQPAGCQQPDKARRAISPPRSVFAAAEERDTQAVSLPRSVFAASRPKDVRAPPSAFGANGEDDANSAFGSPQEKDARAVPSPFVTGAAGPVGPAGPAARGRQAPAGDEKPWEVRPPTSVFAVSSQPLLKDPVPAPAAPGGSPMGQKDVRPPQSAFGAQAPGSASGLARVSPGPSPTAGARPLPDSFFQRRSATEQEAKPAVSGQQQVKSYALPDSPAARLAAQKVSGRGAPGQAGPKGESIFMDDSDEGSDSASSFGRERLAARGSPRTLASERRGQAPAETQQTQPAAPAAAAAWQLPPRPQLPPLLPPRPAPTRRLGRCPPKQRKLQQKKEEPSKPKPGDFYLGDDLADALGPSAGTPARPAAEDMEDSDSPTHKKWVRKGLSNGDLKQAQPQQPAAAPVSKPQDRDVAPAAEAASVRIAPAKEAREVRPVTSAFADSAGAAFSSDEHGSSGSPSSSRSAQHQQRQQPAAGSPTADAAGEQYAAQELLALLPPGTGVGQVEAMIKELRTAAALEASVYLVRSGKGNARRVKAHSVHAPARRLARTTISLGPDEGIAFGLRAVRAIEAAADGCSDVVGMAYWWSNCIQLRWMLWAMCHGGGMGDEGGNDAEATGDEFGWVMQVLVPPLRELESYIFESIFRHLWARCLIDSITNDPHMLSHTTHSHLALHKASAHEDAIRRWLDALQLVHRTLVPASQSATAGHMTLLKQKVLTAILRRLDITLFQKLVQGDDPEISRAVRQTFSGDWNHHHFDQRLGNLADPPLDQKLMPFPRGGLSFGIGVNLKMAVSRWTNWAHDVGIKEAKGAVEGYTYFPKLRATADLLMMPKEVLTDRAIRSEVVPGLSLHRICQILERFQPDDFAADPLPKGLLEQLQNEPLPSGESPNALARLEAGYEPPSESSLLADGLIEPVSLEMDDESDDELEALAEMYDHEKKGDGTHRYTLLKELWSSAR